MVQSTAHYLFFYNVGRKSNVVVIADLASLDSRYGKTHCLVGCFSGLNAISQTLFKAEVPMDLKLDRKIPAGISDKKRCKVFILRGLRIQCTVRVCANSTLLEGLYLDHIPYRISAFVEELHWGHGCRQPPPPFQLSKNSCFFIYQLVGFLVRFQVQKRFCC